MNQWLNRSHPQMLLIAVFLCYFQAAQGLLQALGIQGLGGIVAANDPIIFFAIVLGLGLGGIGIANDKKWGYWAALSASILHVVMYVIVFKFAFLGTTLIVSFSFDVALIGLLTHKQVREYQRAWFR